MRPFGEALKIGNFLPCPETKIRIRPQNTASEVEVSLALHSRTQLDSGINFYSYVSP